MYMVFFFIRTKVINLTHLPLIFYIKRYSKISYDFLNIKGSMLIHTEYFFDKISLNASGSQTAVSTESVQHQ